MARYLTRIVLHWKQIARTPERPERPELLRDSGGEKSIKRPLAPKFPIIDFNRQMERGQNQQLLTSLRKSIVDKPPYISGTLQLPHSCFSIFYKIAKDGLAARFNP
jgi:hypothetical protein